MKHIVHITAILFILTVSTSCNEAAKSITNATQTKSTTDGSDTSTVNSNSITSITPTEGSGVTGFETSSFSEHISFATDGSNTVLISYNFFPPETDVCQQATYDEANNPNGCKTDKTVVVPCEFSTDSAADDLLNINISTLPSSTADECKNPLVLDFTLGSFELNGITLSFSDKIINFKELFEFTISKTGFHDSETGELISFDSTQVTLSDVYDRVIDTRVAAE